MLNDTTPAPIGADAALAQLRHLYRNLIEGGVRDTAQAKRIAEGLLAPTIAALERAALASAAQPPITYAPPSPILGVARSGPGTSAVASAAPAAQGDALYELIEHYGRVVFERCRVGHAEGAIRWDIELGYCDLTASGATLPAAIDAARAAKEGGAA